MTLVVDLYALPDEALSGVGGKIAGLVKLIRAGLPVPSGFCVAADAFLAHVKDLERPSEDLLRSVLEDPIPTEVETEIKRACVEISWPVAVRSSATEEDSATSSFAGQHETVLGVNDLEGVLATLRTCWASFYSERASAYRGALQVDARPTHPPWVLVQEQVPAEASGVGFSIDPLDASERIVINAAPGLGDALVSGKVEPDRFVVDRVSGEIFEAVSSDPDVSPCLSSDDLEKLRELILRAEAAVSAPVDVEFAFAGGKAWLLQARPITARGLEWRSELDSEVPEEFATFTRANASEVLPEVVTPLVHSVLFNLGERGFRRAASEVGVWRRPFDPARPFFQGCFYGRIVLNFSTMLSCAAGLPGQDPEALGENYLGKTRGEALSVKRDPALVRLARLPRLAWVLGSIKRRARRAIRKVDAFFAAEPPSPDLGPDDFAPAAERALRLAEEVLVVHLHGSSLAGASFEALGKAVGRWTGKPDPGLTARLVTGLSTIDSALPTHELWEWSRHVLADSHQADLLRSRSAPEVYAAINGARSDAAQRLRERLEIFLSRYGARGRDAGSAWQEDPRPVLEMLRAFLDLPESNSPAAAALRQQRVREKATAELRARLGPTGRFRLKVLVSSAHRYLSLREKLKGATVKMTSHARGLGLEAGRRLAAAGVIPSSQDAAFLRLDELASLVDSRAEIDSADLRRKIARRRREYERNLSVEIPETFEGRPPPARKAVAPPSGDELRGIPVSPGRVTGKARVIIDPAFGAGIEPGEILVAPITDTGWTPLFAFAAGLVVDLGGQLSHGSIVAREFGLPAVVNVKSATRTIRTGQQVTVDGDLGVVVVHRD